MSKYKRVNTWRWVWDKMMIYNRSFGMPGCTPVWPQNNSQLSRLNSASELTNDVSAIDRSINCSCINITSEVPITPLHSTIDKNQNGGLYVTEISFTSEPLFTTQGTGTGCQLHMAPACTRYQHWHKT